ncbi:MAG TPA: WbqC family protein [Thermoplasmata archaeon]|nr:WbqC family protein [Thermoplasmata archaeon]
MIVAVHQPNYLPYLGFFHKMRRADVLVLYDTAQFVKNEFHNRNRIKTPAGAGWLTVPVRRQAFAPLKDVEIANERRWAESHLRTIEANYRRAPHFETYFGELSGILRRPWSRLADLNAALIDQAARWLSIGTRVVRASALPMPPTEDPTGRLVHLTRAVGGSRYLSGAGGHGYLEESQFTDVRLEYDAFEARAYPQLFGPFLPDLSFVDALLNRGEAAAALLA